MLRTELGFPSVHAVLLFRHHSTRCLNVTGFVACLRGSSVFTPSDVMTSAPLRCASAFVSFFGPAHGPTGTDLLCRASCPGKSTQNRMCHTRPFFTVVPLCPDRRRIDFRPFRR